VKKLDFPNRCAILQAVLPLDAAGQAKVEDFGSGIYLKGVEP